MTGFAALVPCLCQVLATPTKSVAKFAMTGRRAGLHAFAAPLSFASVGIPVTGACFGKPEKSMGRATAAGPRMMSGWGGGGSSASRGEKGRRAGGWGGGNKRPYDDGEGDAFLRFLPAIVESQHGEISRAARLSTGPRRISGR